MIVGKMTLLALVVGFALAFTEGKPLPEKLDPEMMMIMMPEDVREEVKEAWCNETIVPNKKKCTIMDEVSIEHCFGVYMRFVFSQRNSTLDDYDTKKLGKMVFKMKCDGSGDGSGDVTQVLEEVDPTTQTEATSTVSPTSAVSSEVPVVEPTPQMTDNPFVTSPSTPNPVDSGTSTPVKDNGTSTTPEDSGTPTSTPASEANSGKGPENLTPTTGEGDENSALVWIIPLVVLLLLGLALIGFLVHLRVKKTGYLRSTPTKANVAGANGHSEKEKEANGEKEAMD